MKSYRQSKNIEDKRKQSKFPDQDRIVKAASSLAGGFSGPDQIKVMAKKGYARRSDPDWERASQKNKSNWRKTHVSDPMKRISKDLLAKAGQDLGAARLADSKRNIKLPAKGPKLADNPRKSKRK